MTRGGGLLGVTLALLLSPTACRRHLAQSPRDRAMDRVGVYLAETARFTLLTANGRQEFRLGPPFWVPLAGVWTGDQEAIGLFNPETSHFFLGTENSGGIAIAPIDFAFGPAGRGFLPITGDWDGDGLDSVGLYDPFTSTFHLRNENTTGGADVSFVFGNYKDGLRPIAGKWNGGSHDNVGLYDPETSTFSLRVSDDPGSPPTRFTFGPHGAFPIAGDWDGDGRDTVGVYDRPNGRFLLRNSNSGGPPDVVIELGKLPAIPIKGHW